MVWEVSDTSEEVYFVFGAATEVSKLLLAGNKSKREFGSMDRGWELLVVAIDVRNLGWVLNEERVEESTR